MRKSGEFEEGLLMALPMHGDVTMHASRNQNIQPDGAFVALVDRWSLDDVASFSLRCAPWKIKLVRTGSLDDHFNDIFDTDH